jgi:hypothetical protein
MSKNLKVASAHIESVADQGVAAEQFTFGFSLFSGLRAVKNEVHGAEFLCLSSAKGHVPAILIDGDCLLRKTGFRNADPVSRAVLSRVGMSRMADRCEMGLFTVTFSMYTPF